MKRKLIVFLLILSPLSEVFAQGCCSGGSGSPMVGGVSMGVLMQGQFDVGESYQYFYSNRFLAGDKDSSSAMVKDLATSYFYSRLGYGITSKLTLYLEAGYFLHKTETGYDPERPDNVKKSSGIADLIIFPRYNVFENNSEKYHDEITLGLGLKIPLGNYHDSTTIYIDPSTGQRINSVSPPTVQTTTGSNDFIFYGMALREFKKQKLRVFTSATYIHKGYNGMGERFGDFASVGLFTGKTIKRKYGLTAQLRYEWVGKLELNPNFDYVAKGISVEPASTGGSKVSFVPQVSYTYKSLTLFGMYDIPLYQYMNGVQIASRHLATVGFTYRFRPKKFIFDEVEK